MTPAQRAALESLVVRALTDAEVIAIDPLLALDNRNDVAIAAVLSAGRARLQSKFIGIGTIIATLGEDGGNFLDQLETMGAANRNIHWAMANIEQGRLDVGEPATRQHIALLKSALPGYATGLDALLALGEAPDPISFNAVSDALNIAEGRMTL